MAGCPPDVPRVRSRWGSGRGEGLDKRAGIVTLDDPTAERRVGVSERDGCSARRSSPLRGGTPGSLTTGYLQLHGPPRKKTGSAALRKRRGRSRWVFPSRGGLNREKSNMSEVASRGRGGPRPSRVSNWKRWIGHNGGVASRQGNRRGSPRGSSACGWCDQATKGAWRMSRRQKAMKDVGTCEKPEGAGNRAVISGCLNGATQPARVILK